MSKISLMAQVQSQFTLKFINQREINIQFLTQAERKEMVENLKGTTSLPNEFIELYKSNIGFGVWGVTSSTPTIKNLHEFDSLATEMKPFKEEDIEKHFQTKIENPFDGKVFFLQNKQVIEIRFDKEDRFESVLYNSFEDFLFVEEHAAIYFQDDELMISTSWYGENDFESIIRNKNGLFLPELSNKMLKSYLLNDDTYVVLVSNGASKLYFKQQDLQSYFSFLNPNKANSSYVNKVNKTFQKRLFITENKAAEVNLIPYQQIDSLKTIRKARFNQVLSDEMQENNLYDLDNEDVLIISGLGFNNFGILMKKQDFISYLPNSDWKLVKETEIDDKIIIQFNDIKKDFPKHTHQLIQDLFDFLAIDIHQKYDKNIMNLIFEKLENYLSNNILIKKVLAGMIALDGELYIKNNPNARWAVEKKSIKPELITKNGRSAYLETEPYYYIPFVIADEYEGSFNQKLLDDLIEVGWGSGSNED